MTRRLLTPLLLALVAAPPAARAQTPAPATDGLSVSASLRTRLEGWSWFESQAEDEYTFLGTLLRAGVGRQRAGLGWQVELAAPVLVGLPDDAAAPAPQGQSGLGPAYHAANDGEETVADVFLKQAFLRVGAVPGAAGHGVRLGRFEFAEGAEVTPGDPTLAALKRDRIAHRVLGNFGWSHAGRSLDGAQYGYGAPGVNVTALVARPTEGVFSVDGWPELEVGVAYGALTLPLADERNPGEARLFALGYLDYREAEGLVKTDNRPLAARRADAGRVGIATLGGHYLRALATGAGTADVLLWGAYQLGEWGEQDHRAWAGAVEAGFQPAGLESLRPWLRVGYYRSSGDHDPADGDHRTFFQVLPTPRIHSRFPFYNLMNLEDLSGSLILRPGSRVTVRGDARALRLSNAADLWYAGGGAYEEESFGYSGRPSGGSRDLATLLDASVELRLTPRATITAFLGWAGGGEVVEAIYPGGDRARLGYLEVELRR